MKSAERFLPGLDLPALVDELGINIYYAREESSRCPGALEAEDWCMLKRTSMARALDECRSSGAFDSSQRLSVISIGDSEIELDALQGLIAASAGILDEKPLCKVIKLMDRPTAAILSSQLQALLRWLEGIALHEHDLEWRISHPGDITRMALGCGFD